MELQEKSKSDLDFGRSANSSSTISGQTVFGKPFLCLPCDLTVLLALGDLKNTPEVFSFVLPKRLGISSSYSVTFPENWLRTFEQKLAVSGPVRSGHQSMSPGPILEETLSGVKFES